MKKLLHEIYGLNVQEIIPHSRKDSGNDNDLFKVLGDGKEYFLKEIPGHSKRGDLDLIYRELNKCVLDKSKLVLPIKSLQGKYLVNVKDKEVMLYPYISHKVFNEVNVDLHRTFEVLEDLFNGFKKILIPAHPFKTYNNWFERGPIQIRKKVDHHKFLDLFENFIRTRFTELNFEIGNTHFDLNPFNIWLDDERNILISDFDNAQVAAYAKDIFDTCSKYVEVSSDGVRIEESDLEKIFSFSKKYISNIEHRDLKFLLLRPKLGNLFDPKSNYSEKELIKKMDDLFDFFHF